MQCSRTVLRAATLALVVLTVACLAPSQARADQITTYDVTGTFADSSLLSGSITIDTTANTVTLLDLTVGANPPIVSNNPTHAFMFPNSGELLIEAYNSNFSAELLLDLPVPSLVDVTSLPLGSATTPSNSKSFYQSSGGGEGTPIPLVFGALSPAPEPASLALLISGSFAACGLSLFRRRSQKLAAASPAL
jgi:hypothetical protein